MYDRTKEKRLRAKKATAQKETNDAWREGDITRMREKMVKGEGDG